MTLRSPDVVPSFNFWSSLIHLSLPSRTQRMTNDKPYQPTSISLHDYIPVVSTARYNRDIEFG